MQVPCCRRHTGMFVLKDQLVWRALKWKLLQAEKRGLAERTYVSFSPIIDIVKFPYIVLYSQRLHCKFPDFCRCVFCNLAGQVGGVAKRASMSRQSRWNKTRQWQLFEVVTTITSWLWSLACSWLILFGLCQSLRVLCSGFSGWGNNYYAWFRAP